jgi:hypothetical protein
MTDKQFLLWLRDRLVNRYGESPDVDFIIRLQAIAYRSDDYYRHGPFSTAPTEVK